MQAPDQSGFDCPDPDSQSDPETKAGLEESAVAKALSSILAAAILFAHLGSALGPVVPVVSLGAPLAIFLLLRNRVDARLQPVGWLLALPTFALASTIWSRMPMMTFHYAGQLAITVLGALAIWLTADVRGFVRQLFAASLAICLVSLASGHTGPSTTGPVLVGITGSKNAMAAVGQCVVFCGLALALDRGQPPLWRVAGALATPLGGWIVAVTQAATIKLLTLLAPVICVAVMALHACPAKIRPFLTAGLLLATVAGGSVAGKVAERAEDATLKTFNKDKGLTGRTYLWDVAWQKIVERPVQGYGYKAFWMSGSADSIGLLRSQRIADPRTFSLHQTYLEVWLDLGLGGLAIAATMLASGLIAALYRAVRFCAAPDIFLAVSLVSLVVRSFGDTLFQPFYAYGTIAVVLIAFALFGAGTSERSVAVADPRRRRQDRAAMSFRT
ncbi:O-antigen ligase family protein [Novosphingobium sp. BL-8H]|uniref:O-antigen ligase family protein n=1 Tax=Novosphingobium sp. BL-8H TaxID=3127640 RepID=UPI0037578CF0